MRRNRERRSEEHLHSSSPIMRLSDCASICARSSAVTAESSGHARGLGATNTPVSRRAMRPVPYLNTSATATMALGCSMACQTLMSLSQRGKLTITALIVIDLRQYAATSLSDVGRDRTAAPSLSVGGAHEARHAINRQARNSTRSIGGHGGLERVHSGENRKPKGENSIWGSQTMTRT